jgi:hypothetical protein
MDGSKPKRLRRDPAQKARPKGGRGVKLTITFTAEALRRLRAHQAGTGRGQSAVVCDAVIATCNRYVLHDLGGGKGGGVAPGGSGDGQEAGGGP